MNAARWVRVGSVFATVAAFSPSLRADDVLFRWEGDVLPYVPGAGWVINRACQGGCSESLQDGHLVVTYVEQTVAGAFLYNYHHPIARIDEPQPPTLWVEWGFRSEQPLPPFAYTCDGSIALQYEHFFDVAYIFGDAAVSRSGDQVVRGLDMSEFHTYRFESTDGIHYRMSVDGLVFFASYDDNAIGGAFVQFGGDGGCGPEYFPTVNEWDFVRYGTVAYGEQIVASDPPAGFVAARSHAPLDRFTVTYDSPNYAYIDEIAVGVSAGVAPAVVATRRLDNGPPDVVQIVLDRPIPYNATTRFTFNDGVAVNTVEYTFAPGDTDGDGDADLADFAAFQNCFEVSPISDACLVLDFNADPTVNLLDFAAFQTAFARR